MESKIDNSDAFPVVRSLRDFDLKSGGRFERLIFNHRTWVVAIFVLLSFLLSISATKLTANASFESMIPQSHPYIRNYLDNKDSLRGLGNSVRVVVETKNGTIFDPTYIEKLKQINDALFLIPGVDRSWMKSLWAPSVRWTEVTEQGFQAGPVMPDHYDGSANSREALRQNIGLAGLVGNLVGNDFKSSTLVVPLLDKDPETGKPLDYVAFSNQLKQKVLSQADRNTVIRVVGFAELASDLIAGLRQVVLFFGISIAIATVIMLAYTRCWRSTLILVGCSLMSVVWMLGLMHLLGYTLDPYSILVPFLVFAIGLSHGAQKMNGIMQDVARGVHKYVAARYTFRRLFLAGLTALLTNVVGFAVLMTIDIPVIRELALTTSIGVSVLIFTKLILVPVALSYIGVSQVAAARSVRGSAGRQGRGLWRVLAVFTTRNGATAAVLIATLMGVGGYSVSRHLKIGDLDAGAPELRPNSRYNIDNAYVTSHYRLSSDQFAVIVKTPPGGCRSFQSLLEEDRLGVQLADTPGVQSVSSPSSLVRLISASNNEGNPKWMTISRNPLVVAPAMQNVIANYPELVSNDCSVVPVIASLDDHRAETLSRVVEKVEAFAQQHDTADRKFLLAAGSAGIEAVTNIVVESSNRQMLALLYSAVVILCFITFRSVRGVIVAVLPLVLTSVLCEALMVALGIGVKVATLPVIALGVGVGVDYALYLLSIQLALQRRGATLAEAYRRAVEFTGKVVALVALTLAAGVGTWAFSAIKFQADMGILLTFMFIWNMVGALVLIPALSYFLLRNVAPKGTEVSVAAPMSNEVDGATDEGAVLNEQPG
ncbi:efflux RND transporter permease subunit [Paraburkholderia phytofirmans]|uniref:efflux RND transporter permease subunit n=1 Tax=Paraburkholderia phytofirmans TaxID=261302 RepID=UPI0038BB26CC